MRILALLILLISTSSNAEVDCKGKISRLALQINNGVVILGLVGGPNAAQLCSIKDTENYNGVASEVCRTLYGTLLAAKASDKNTTIRFYSHDSCTTPELSWKAAGTLGYSAHMQD
ncbi:hypothetical protein [Colwellia psychrerythraea]|uniref:Uncharacterized protein n=1 Tax=Colwellia psychrerythraea TaxID=28229 RepID=A0A099KS08_COLPS|nr:hypothetical protein [Colwellia psychrerythraea]KGJ93326.1 hypothetical protein GAB14E_2650 [Colwellia psychrerythraea]